VANTDLQWFRFLREMARRHGARTPEEPFEVNFWTPSGKVPTRLVPGDLVFFKLKAPVRAVGGFGVFSHATRLPLWLAWDTFGEANGVPGLEEFARRIAANLHGKAKVAEIQRHTIGCLVLVSPVFFEDDARVPEPADWSANIVSGKFYDLARGEGRRLLEACRKRAALGPLREEGQDMPGVAATTGAGDAAVPWREGRARIRMGQGSFRLRLLDAYGRACAVTGEHSLPALEAAHIRPFHEQPGYDPRNGVILRSDIHRLFDKGYVTITPEYRFEVGRRLREDWHNGRTYYPLHGTEVHVPEEPALRPDPALLAWHNENVFLG